MKACSFFRYKSFGGSSRYLEYEYTYKDCVANRKQSHILEECGCYSDLLQVPYIREPDDDPMAKGIAKFLDFSKMKVDFCRDVFSRTSQRARRNFECHERLIKMPTSKVLDAYVNPDLLYNARDDPDMTKKLRQAVCPVKCSTVDLNVSWTSTIFCYARQRLVSKFRHFNIFYLAA